MAIESGLRVPEWYFRFLKDMDVRQYVLDHVFEEPGMSGSELEPHLAVMLKLMEFPDFAAHNVSITGESINFHLVTTDNNIKTIEDVSLKVDITDYFTSGLGVDGIECRLYPTPSIRGGGSELRSRDAIVNDMLEHSSDRPVPATLGSQYMLSITYDSTDALVRLFETLEARRDNEAQEDS